jgi:transcriptional regulator with XRE-family HTH domain
MSKQLITRQGIAELVRRKFGGSQAALARALKADASTISRWVRGPSTPDWPTQILLKQWLDEARAGALGVKARRRLAGEKLLLALDAWHDCVKPAPERTP